MCESDQTYVPLNDGYNWKGDPNATLSGQDVPQLSGAEYDPTTGTYTGPDGTGIPRATLHRSRSTPKTGDRWCCPATELSRTPRGRACQFPIGSARRCGKVFLH